MDKKYIDFIADLKKNIVQSRYIAARLANKEQLLLYFKTGRMLSEKIDAEEWGANVLEQIAEDLQKQLPGLRGFSHRNLRNMRQFAFEYSPLLNDYQQDIIWQSATAKLQDNLANPIGPSVTAQLSSFWGITFSHHMLLLNKCKTIDERFFYMEQAATQFWSVNILEHHINADLYKHQGRLPNNFDKTLPTLKPSALLVFRDEYLMDFIGSADADDERVLEQKVVADIKNFILKMGNGFCFIGNQYRLEIDGEEFFIDLLFFNRHLQCLVAFELKRGKFKPEYAGQLNFYLNVLDEKVRLSHENPTIGIVLCKEKNNTVVEFAVRSIDKAMGVATYRTTKEVPKEMKGILPDADELARLL
jgi:predicted nuclease of restriction endonuclease-like (RecB) superfamily